MAQGFEDLGAVDVIPIIPAEGFSDLGAIPVPIPNVALTEIPIEQTDLAQRVAAGYVPTRQEVQKLAAERLVAQERALGFRPNDLILRPEAQQLSYQTFGAPLDQPGEVFSTSQFDPGLQGRILEAALGTRGAASSAGLGIPGAVGKVIEDLVLNDAQKRILGAQAMAERAPDIAMGGEMVGGLLPVTTGTGIGARMLTQPQRGLFRGVLPGAATGATAGGIQQMASAIGEEGLSADPLEVAIKGAVGAGLGAGLGGAIPLVGNIPGATKRAFTRGFGPSYTEKATGLLGITKQDGVDEVLAVANPRILEKYGKAPKTVPEGIKAADQTQTALLKEAQESLNVAAEQGLAMKGNTAFQALEETLSSIKTLPKKEAASILKDYQNKYSDFTGDIDPIEGQKLLARLNKELKSYYKTGADTSVPEIEAKVAFRDSLSDQLDDIVRGVSGKDSSPYRDIGKLIQFESGLYNKINKTQLSTGSAAVGEKELLEGNEVTKLGLIRRGLNTVKRPFVKGAEEKLDITLEDLFRTGPKEIITPDLSEDVQNAIYQNYSRSIPAARAFPSQEALKQQLVNEALSSPLFRGATPETLATTRRALEGMSIGQLQGRTPTNLNIPQ